MIAAVLHLEKESRPDKGRRSHACRRLEIRREVIEDFPFARIGEAHVGVGHRRHARVRVIDVAPGQDEVRFRVPASQAVDHGAQLAVRLGGHGAAVDDADVRVLVGLGDRKTGARQLIAEVLHLREIHLATERVDRDFHGRWTRIAAATSGARRARRMRGPRLTATAPRARSMANSSSVQPPSGPTAMV